MSGYHYFAVNYHGDNENKLYIVPQKWITDEQSILPFISYTFYNPLTIDIQVLPKPVLLQLISDNFNNKERGYTYKAKIIHGFGEYELSSILSYIEQ